MPFDDLWHHLKFNIKGHFEAAKGRFGMGLDAFYVHLGAPELILIGRGDVGAGGAKLDWSASGDLAYRLGKGWLVDVGYRTLDVDYDKAGVEGRERALFDVSMHGPRLFIAYSW